MGVDLTLLPELYPSSSGAIYPYIVLPLNRRHELWDKIQKELNIQTLNREIYWCNDDEGLLHVANDPYGTPLTFVMAQELFSTLAEFNDSEGNTDWRNLATAAYVGEIPPLTRIILWWH